MSLSTAYAALANVYVNLNRKAGCRYVYSCKFSVIETCFLAFETPHSHD